MSLGYVGLNKDLEDLKEITQSASKNAVSAVLSTDGRIVGLSWEH